MILAVCGLLAAGLFAYVFVLPQGVEHVTEKTRLTYLRERREVLYENLRDLTFEHRAGKLPDADFQSMRGAMEDEAATLLAEIEVLEGQGNGSVGALLSSAPSTSRQSK
jgi:hypothetical protein